ncbi:hypothetical protein OG871_40070 (plasmid) [Kitasatospora sp. NBC_00374]|uniref:hypothetical protein n=1 Tax=Kitasatospora sp. NBC_00374 TaxID=2975964 RepID=UPI0030E55665
MTVEAITELPQHRRGTRNLTMAQRVISDVLAALADALYEDSPQMTRDESMEAAALLLGDRPAVLMQHAEDLFAAHADLNSNQAVNGAAMQLGYLPFPPSGSPHGFPRGFRIEALAPAGARAAGPADEGPDPTG